MGIDNSNSLQVFFGGDLVERQARVEVGDHLHVGSFGEHEGSRAGDTCAADKGALDCVGELLCANDLFYIAAKCSEKFVRGGGLVVECLFGIEDTCFLANIVAMLRKI